MSWRRFRYDQCSLFRRLLHRMIEGVLDRVDHSHKLYTAMSIAMYVATVQALLMTAEASVSTGREKGLRRDIGKRQEGY